MEEMTLNIPVNVKAILTDSLRAQLNAEMKEALKNVDLELQQLEFQAKRMVADQQKQNPDALPQLYAFLDAERLKREEFRRDTEARIDRLDKLETGAEISNGTIERTVTLKIGDDLHKYMGAEILLQDGKIIAFRM